MQILFVLVLFHGCLEKWNCKEKESSYLLSKIWFLKSLLDFDFSGLKSAREAID